MICWSLLAGSVLQRRYRTLALCEALRATAALLRARARLLADPGQAADADALRSWIQGEAVLAERLQGARDFVFAAPDSARARRDSAILLSAIDLRDMLLASRLDLELLGSDASALWLLDRAAEGLNQIASQLDAAVAALRSGTLPAAPADDDADRRFEQAPLAADDDRARLLPLIASRLRGLAADAARIHALLRGEPAVLPLSREQLRHFVAPEGWPLQALRAQWTGHSPVLRHALRAALALGSAYFIALALPWASHPHWLVLSVAVVLRGSLDQTLARRNARVLGTLFGCVLVVALTHAESAAWLTLVFLLAVATAHAFALQRYWVTATAATVMALLQAHLVNPGGGLAIGERIADTLLGAALAWAFCYVLPAWERRRLPLAVDRVLRDLDGYARHALAPSGAGFGHRAQQLAGGLDKLEQLRDAILLYVLQDQFVDAAHHRHGHTGRQRCGAFAAGFTAIDHAQHEISDLLVDAAARGEAFRAEPEDLDEQRSHQHRVLLHAAEIGRHRALHLGLPFVLGIDRVAQHLQRVVARRLVERDQALGLGGEMFVERPARHAGFAHDVGNRRVRVAFGRHCAGHALEQAMTVFMNLCFS